VAIELLGAPQRATAGDPAGNGSSARQRARRTATHGAILERASTATRRSAQVFDEERTPRGGARASERCLLAVAPETSASGPWSARAGRALPSPFRCSRRIRPQEPSASSGKWSPARSRDALESMYSRGPRYGRLAFFQGHGWSYRGAGACRRLASGGSYDSWWCTGSDALTERLPSRSQGRGTCHGTRRDASETTAGQAATRRRAGR